MMPNFNFYNKYNIIIKNISVLAGPPQPIIFLCNAKKYLDIESQLLIIRYC